MQLPESLTKVTPLSKGIAIVLFALLPFLGFLLGVKYQQLINPVKKDVTSIDQNKQSILEESLSYCLEDKAKQGQESKEVYNYTSFGINSSLLQSLEVKVIPYEYKTNIIINKAITGTETLDGYNWGISAWYLDSYKNYFSELADHGYPLSIKNYPTFDGYENYGKPHWLSEKINRWKTSKETYTNTQGIKMYWSQDGIPVSASTILEFFHPYPPSGKPTLYLVWLNEGVSKCQPYGFDDPCIAEEKGKIQKALKKIANTISLNL